MGACTTILYEGKPVRTLNSGAFWRIVSEYKVNIKFTAPTAIRTIKKEDDAGFVVKRLPKTRSGKILRKILRNLVDDVPFQIPSTIENPDALIEIKQCLSNGNNLL